jgi:hypothetical protein
LQQQRSRQSNCKQKPRLFASIVAMREGARLAAIEIGSVTPIYDARALCCHPPAWKSKKNFSKLSAWAEAMLSQRL